MFTDGVTYTNSVSNSMWAVFLAICELPPILRFSSENIIFHSLWSAPDLDFNLFLKIYNEIDDLLNNGIQFNDIKLRVRIHIFTGDSPGRCKALNTVQHTGYYSCLMCDHPSERNSNNTANIFPLKLNSKSRTHLDYIQQVNEAIENGMKTKCPKTKGIKGFTYLSNWITIPDSVVIDYMHLCLLSSLRDMINAFFVSSNHNCDFYIGKLT